MPAFRWASQTVLMKGINDDTAIMMPLMQGLLKRRVKPYYLYQMRSDSRLRPFPHDGRKGHRDHQALRGHTTGYATPIFAWMRRAAAARSRLRRISWSGRDGDDLLLRNFEGEVYRYPDPGGTLGSDKPGCRSGISSYAHRGHL